MARRNYLSALGGVGELGLWGAALYFLPSRILDVGRGARFDPALARGARHVHLARAGPCRNCDVVLRARMAYAPRSHPGRGGLCGESVSPRQSSTCAAISPNCSPARYFRWCLFGALRLAARGLASLAVACAAVCRGLAFERACRRARDLFSRLDILRSHPSCAAAARPLLTGGLGNGRGIRPRRVLYSARGVGTALGANSPGHRGHAAPRTEFSFHAQRRSGIYLLQLESFGAWRWW